MRSRSKVWAPTTRDVAIINALDSFGWLNTTQITMMFFKPDKPKTGEPKLWLETSAQALSRLSLLKKKDIIGMAYPLIEHGAGIDPCLWFKKKTAKDTGPNLWSDDYKHDKLARTIAAQFVVGARISQFPLVAMKGERELIGEYAPYQADGYLSIQFDAGNAHHIFIEADNGTESERKWQEKLARIDTFLGSAEYKAIYQHHRVRFAIVAPSEQRVFNLKRWTEESGCGSKFWFTLQSRLNPSTALDSSIWLVAGQEGLHHFSKTSR